MGGAGVCGSLSPQGQSVRRRVKPLSLGGAMKYALLIYSSPESRDIPEDQLKSIVSEYEALSDEPGVLDGMQLQGTESATTVRVQQDGDALLSDGPFVDAKE